MRELTIRVRDYKAGDRLLDKGRHVYTIDEVTAATEGPAATMMTAEVTWADGGHDTRAWQAADLDHEVTIQRPEPKAEQAGGNG
jgi:hypothetical protein